MDNLINILNNNKDIYGLPKTPTQEQLLIAIFYKQYQLKLDTAYNIGEKLILLYKTLDKILDNFTNNVIQQQYNTIIIETNKLIEFYYNIGMHLADIIQTIKLTKEEKSKKKQGFYKTRDKANYIINYTTNFITNLYNLLKHILKNIKSSRPEITDEIYKQYVNNLDIRL